MPATIRRGSNSPLVLTWQNQMNAWFAAGNVAPAAWTNTRGEARGFPGGRFRPLRLDGVFGAGTEIATEGWQAANGLAPDGVVGPASWSVALRAPVNGLPPLLRGVDVSAMQGQLRAADWTAMRDQGIRLCIARACVGNEAWIDAQAARSIAACRDQGIAPGVYFFSYPLRHIDPRTQVDEWLRRLESVGLPLDGLIWALDMEWPPREEKKDGALVYPWQRWGIDASSIAEWNLRALERGRELVGREWLRYSFRYFLECIEAPRYPELAAGDLWLADYWSAGRWPMEEETAKRKAPAPWASVAIFQHDGDGGLRLPNGVDADFNVVVGGEATLKRLAASSAPPAREASASRLAGAPSLDREPLMPDDAIATYRRQRLTGEPDAP